MKNSVSPTPTAPTSARSGLAVPILFLILSCMVPADARADDRQAVIDAYMKAFKIQNYRVILRNMGDSGQDASVDVEMPDKFHMRSAQGEFIVHPSGTWSRQGGRWMKVPMDMTGIMEAYRAPSQEQAERDIGEVTYVGDETIDGCASRNYRYRSDSADFGTGSRGDEVLLSICGRTGLPIRVKPSSDPASLHYDFDAQVAVRPPH